MKAHLSSRQSDLRRPSAPLSLRPDQAFRSFQHRTGPPRKGRGGRGDGDIHRCRRRLRFDPAAEIHVNRSDVDLILPSWAFTTLPTGSGTRRQLVHFGGGTNTQYQKPHDARKTSARTVNNRPMAQLPPTTALHRAIKRFLLSRRGGKISSAPSPCSASTDISFAFD